MKIELAGWESKGLRCPDVSIDLTDGDTISPVTLIQMPNGTGKTTTLTLIRAAMNGEANNWNSERIKRLRRSDESHSEGQFILHLRIDDRPLTFQLKLDFEIGTAQYFTTAPGSGGIKQGWEPPINVRRFLDNRFVRLFVFDGEFADKLLNAKESEASKAIDALFQLYLLDEIKQKSEYFLDIVTKNQTGTTQKALTQRRNKVDRLERQIQEVKNDKERLDKEKSSLELSINKLSEDIEKYLSENKGLRKQLEEKRREEQQAQNQVENAALEVMQRIRQPHLLHEYFSRSLVELKQQLDRLRLPASTSSQFFSELLDEEDCICGRPLDDLSRQNIMQRSQIYLAEDASGILNTIKQDIEEKVRQEGNETAVDLKDKLEQLEEAVGNRDRTQTAVRVFERELIDRGDDQLKSWQSDLDEKKARKQKLDSKLEEIHRYQRVDDNETTYCLASLKDQLKKARSDLAQATNTVELRKKIDILQHIVDVAVEKARINLREAIAQDCNNRLRKILSRDPIQIEKIDRSLKLLNQEGASVGQTLSVGYTFLTTLLNRGQHQFPLIIDTPAGPLDIDVRRKIAELIPQLCNQFVAFTTSSEREGFTNEIALNCKGQTKFLTLFRQTEETEVLRKSLPDSGVTQTDNAVLIEGQDYFDRFDIEQVGG